MNWSLKAQKPGESMYQDRSRWRPQLKHSRANSLFLCLFVLFMPWKDWMMLINIGNGHLFYSVANSNANVFWKHPRHREITECAWAFHNLVKSVIILAQSMLKMSFHSLLAFVVSDYKFSCKLFEDNIYDEPFISCCFQDWFFVLGIWQFD